MPSEIKREVTLEIVHVLFLDIVGYSQRLTDEQQALIDQLNQVVRSSAVFQKAEGADRLIKIPTGDGMALIFYNTPGAAGRVRAGNQPGVEGVARAGRAHGGA
jgi:hypothetical protein